MGLPHQRKVAGVAAVNPAQQHIEGGFRCKLHFLVFPLNIIHQLCLSPGIARCCFVL